MQNWGQNQSWTPGALQTKKRKGNFSMQPQKEQIKFPQSTWCTLHLWNTWIDNKSSQNRDSGLYEQLYTWGLLSVTDLFQIFMFLLVYFLALVILGGFVYSFGCSLLFYYYCFLKFFYFNNFFYYLYFFFLFSLFFWAVWLTGSWCSSLVSGLSLWDGRAEFRALDHQRPPGPK